jgi:23S rRNA G2069 N7-methylase RlmK/C1962 C5-methylase RlmI
LGLGWAWPGPTSVTLLDRSAPALEAATRSAELNGVGARCHVRQQEVFEALDAMAAAAERFDIVIVDPPAFAKSRKDIPVAVKAYRKLVRQAAGLVSPGGILFAASCSHNVGVPARPVRRRAAGPYPAPGRGGPRPSRPSDAAGKRLSEVADPGAGLTGAGR